jgi:hypothetical protein
VEGSGTECRNIDEIKFMRYEPHHNKDHIKITGSMLTEFENVWVNTS